MTIAASVHDHVRHVVHCIDTGGLLGGGIASAFERINRLSDPDLAPVHRTSKVRMISPTEADGAGIVVSAKPACNRRLYGARRVPDGRCFCDNLGEAGQEGRWSVVTEARTLPLHAFERECVGAAGSSGG